MAGIAQGDGNLQWTEDQLQRERDTLRNVQPTNSFPFNILLVGLVGAGKSSFINTVFTALTGKIKDLSFTAKVDVSVTTSLCRYSLQEKQCPVVLLDTMGFEQDSERSGLCTRDVEYMLDGHIKVGYKFKANEPIGIGSPYFNTKPEDKDKVHTVAFVVNATNVESYVPDVFIKVQEVCRQADNRKIRWAFIMTHIDKACPCVSGDVTTVFDSDTIKDFISVIDARFGAKSSNVFLIQNYVSENKAGLPMNILALRTLNGITQLAALTLDSQAREPPLEEGTPNIQLLTSPWRNENNLTEQAVHEMRATLIQTLQKNGIKAPGIQGSDKLRLCFMGPSGGGKSDFINSILSEFQYRIITLAETGISHEAPTTARLKVYQPQHKRDGPGLNIELIDTMGFRADTCGILTDDIPTVLDGKVNVKNCYLESIYFTELIILIIKHCTLDHSLRSVV